MPQEPPATRKTSLRRLSSLANLNFNPFSRRRSNPAVDVAALASSDAAQPSPAIVLDASGRDPPMAHFSSSTSGITGWSSQPKPTFSERRRTYTTLAEGSCNPLPRSRTLSNLPVPAKTKASATLPQSKSNIMLPPSRIPTPPKLETRARLVSTTRGILKPTKMKGLQRSDTEPLLLADAGSSVGIPRTTAFKENLALSPIKPLSKMHIFEEDYVPETPSSLATQTSWYGEQGVLARPSPTTAFRTSQIGRKPTPQSSPIKKVNARRPFTPAQVSRHNSQPVLPNTTYSRVSYSGNIKQHQLLTPRQPPTPQPPLTPLRNVSAVTNRTQHTHPAHVCRDPELSPCIERNTPSILAIDPDKVLDAEPIEYWCGRMSVLTDRYRNERFVRCLELGQPANMENEEETHDRIRRALQHLYSVCASEEAEESFRAFYQRLCAICQLRQSRGEEDAMAAFVPWNQIVPMAEERRKKNTWLRRSEHHADGDDTSEEALLAASLSRSTVGSMRKVSFMGRLLGKNRRSAG